MLEPMKRRDFVKTFAMGLVGLKLAPQKYKDFFKQKEKIYSVSLSTDYNELYRLDNFQENIVGTSEELRKFYRETFLKYHPFLEEWDKDLENVITALENDQNVLSDPGKPFAFDEHARLLMGDLGRKLSPHLERLYYFGDFKIDKTLYDFAFDFYFSAGHILGLREFEIEKRVEMDKGYKRGRFKGDYEMDFFETRTDRDSITYGIHYDPVQDSKGNEYNPANYLDMMRKRQRLIKALHNQKAVQKFLNKK